MWTVRSGIIVADLPEPRSFSKIASPSELPKAAWGRRETLGSVTERRHGAAGGSVGRTLGALSLGSGSNRLGAFYGAPWVKPSRSRIGL